MATGGNKSAGFTIVETLIVLAVSALVAGSTLLAISGRQNKTQFMVASNTMKQRIEQIINETRNGYYPGTGDFTCTGNTASTPPTIDTVAPKAQGSNNTCVFLGKAVEFGVAKTAPLDPVVFATYPLVGNREVNAAGATQEVTNYAQAKPIALAPGTAVFPVDHSEFSRTQNGLSFKKAIYHRASGDVVVNGYAVLAFADDLSGYSFSGGNLDSATEKLNLYYFNASPDWGALAPTVSSAYATSAHVVDVINSKNVNEIPADVLNSLDLCFDSGTTGQSATISITGLGQLSVKLKVSNSAC